LPHFLALSLSLTTLSSAHAIAANASPAFSFGNALPQATAAGGSLPSLHTRDLSTGFGLSILAIGDSITAGVGSSDKNGYRLALRKLLQYSQSSLMVRLILTKQMLTYVDTDTIDFIGTQVNGDGNLDNQ
jgi:lysophospholipase L1-like esterase